MTRPQLDAARWIELPSHADARGVLTVTEAERDIPFAIRRVYWLHHLRTERGGHAHRDTQQVVIAAAGRFRLSLSDGGETRAFELDRANVGDSFGPMLFIRIHDVEPDAVALVLASTHYDKTRSLRSWAEYQVALGRHSPPEAIPVADMVERP